MDPSRTVVLKLDHASESPGRLVKARTSGFSDFLSVGLEEDL